jgi:hypothetical protein
VAGGRSADLGATPPPSITPASRGTTRSPVPASQGAVTRLSAWAPRPHMAGSMAGGELEEGLQRRKLDSPATWELDLPAPRGSIMTAWELHRDSLLYGGSLSSGGLPLQRRPSSQPAQPPPQSRVAAIHRAAARATARLIPASLQWPRGQRGKREVGATGGAGGATFFGSLPPQPRQRARFPAVLAGSYFTRPFDRAPAKNSSGFGAGALPSRPSLSTK